MTQNVVAQNIVDNTVDNSDVSLRLDFILKKKISDNLTISAENEICFKENVSSFEAALKFRFFR